MAIKEEDLNIYRYNVTPLQYAEFLLGYHWDRNMMNIDYENVIQHLNEYILAYGYTGIGAEGRIEDVSLYSSQYIDSTSSKKMPGLKELGFAGAKCLTLDIPFQKDVLLDKFWLWVRPDIFFARDASFNYNWSSTASESFHCTTSLPQTVFQVYN